MLSELVPLILVPIPHTYGGRCKGAGRYHEAMFHSLALCLLQWEHIYFCISESFSHSLAGFPTGP